MYTLPFFYEITSLRIIYVHVNKLDSFVTIYFFVILYGMRDGGGPQKSST